MIKTVNKNVLMSDKNIIVHQVNCQGVMGTGVAQQIAEMYPHVEREYLKYLRYCKKNNINPLGTCQYVPVDSWALGLMDTMKNNDLYNYDEPYQFIANLFGQKDIGNGKQQTDLVAFEKGLRNVKNKAKILHSGIALPYGIASVRGGAKWEDVYTIIEKVFKNTDIDVEICKLS